MDKLEAEICSLQNLIQIDSDGFGLIAGREPSYPQFFRG